MIAINPSPKNKRKRGRFRLPCAHKSYPNLSAHIKAWLHEDTEDWCGKWQMHTDSDHQRIPEFFEEEWITCSDFSRIEKYILLDYLLEDSFLRNFLNRWNWGKLTLFWPMADEPGWRVFRHGKWHVGSLFFFYLFICFSCCLFPTTPSGGFFFFRLRNTDLLIKTERRRKEREEILLGMSTRTAANKKQTLSNSAKRWAKKLLLQSVVIHQKHCPIVPSGMCALFLWVHLFRGLWFHLSLWKGTSHISADNLSDLPKRLCSAYNYCWTHN